MRRLCPQCQGTFEKQFLCPKCGVQLMELSGRSTVLAARDHEEAQPVGMVTRFVAGFLLAQCTYYGLQLLLGSGVRLIGGDPTVLTPGLLLLSVLVAAMLAGAGNSRGLAAGAGVGLFHALAVIGAMFALGQSPPMAVLYGGWLVVILLGAASGRFGRYVWAPLSDLHDPTPAVQAAPVEKTKTRAEPVPWGRVIIGGLFAAGCTIGAERIREFVVGTSGGIFTADSRFQLQFVTWIIAALAIIAGGAVAGASTRAGAKHGFFAGVFAFLTVFLIQSQVLKDALAAERFFAVILGLSEEGGETLPRVALFLISHTLFLSLFGGWFGAALLPRTAAGPSRLDRGAI